MKKAILKVTDILVRDIVSEALGLSQANVKLESVYLAEGCFCFQVRGDGLPDECEAKIGEVLKQVTPVVKRQEPLEFVKFLVREGG